MARRQRSAVPAAMSLTLLFAASSSLAVTTPPPPPPVAPAANPAPVAAPTANETLVSRIALYPDDLIGIILPASTFPLQVVEAARYLDDRAKDAKLPVKDSWDASVKSLLNYPTVIKAMNSDLDWMQSLGGAVVADQNAVLAAVQSYRRKVYAAGNLKTDQKQVVAMSQDIITIVPANPQVIYVPQYNPTTIMVYGSYSSWGYYGYGYPSYYYPYPPGAALATGLIWGAAIGAAWNGGHYAPYYGGGYGGGIHINNGDININNSNRPGGGTANAPGAGGGGTAWKPATQPSAATSRVGGTTGPSSTTAAGRGGASAGQYGPSAAAAGSARAGSASAGSYGPPSPGASDRGGYANAGSSRASASTGAASAGQYGGNRSGYGGGSGASAFGGYGSGASTSMASSRGSMSRGASGGGGRRH